MSYNEDRENPDVNKLMELNTKYHNSKNYDNSLHKLTQVQSMMKKYKHTVSKDGAFLSVWFHDLNYGVHLPTYFQQSLCNL